MNTTLRFIAAAFIVFIIGTAWMGSCLCSVPPDNRTKLERCIDSCDVSQINCGLLCKDDAICNRTCAAGYRDCVAICDREGK
jgi:hypothetical protein